MTSEHHTATPQAAAASDGIRSVSVLLYSDDITTRDAVLLNVLDQVASRLEEVRPGSQPGDARRRGDLMA